MAGGFKITDKDKGLDKLLKQVAKRKSRRVIVGIYGKKASEKHEYINVQTAAGIVKKKVKNPPTVGEIAAAHEFGLGVPKRSFLRDTVKINEHRIRHNLSVTTERVVSGEDTEERALRKFGVWFEGVVKQRIADGIPPKLHPITIRRKGSSKPLIDTGQLRNAVTSKLEGE